MGHWIVKIVGCPLVHSDNVGTGHHENVDAILIFFKSFIYTG